MDRHLRQVKVPSNQIKVVTLKWLHYGKLWAGFPAMVIKFSAGFQRLVIPISSTWWRDPLHSFSKTSAGSMPDCFSPPPPPLMDPSRLYISLQLKCWERVLPSITCRAAASQHSRARCRARDHLRRHISHIMQAAFAEVWVTLQKYWKIV